MLNTIYETGYDLHVANYVAYLHTDKKLYEDEADKTYLPVALLAAGVVVTDGTTAVTCTAADADPA